MQRSSGCAAGDDNTHLPGPYAMWIVTWNTGNTSWLVHRWNSSSCDSLDMASRPVERGHVPVQIQTVPCTHASTRTSGPVAMIQLVASNPDQVTSYLVSKQHTATCRPIRFERIFGPSKWRDCMFGRRTRQQRCGARRCSRAWLPHTGWPRAASGPIAVRPPERGGPCASLQSAPPPAGSLPAANLGSVTEVGGGSGRASVSELGKEPGPEQNIGPI